MLLIRHDSFAAPWEIRVTGIAAAYTPESVQRFGSRREALVYAKTPKQATTGKAVRDNSSSIMYAPEKGMRFATLPDALRFAVDANYITRAEALEIEKENK